MADQKPRKKARRITPEYLHNAALYYLQRYAASSGRVREVLARKIKRSCHDHPDQNEQDLLKLINTEIETLVRVELLHDDRLGTQLVSNWRARGISTRMIGIKLRQRGFTPELIATLLTDTSNDEEDQQQNELAAALRYLRRRKLGPFALINKDDRQAALKNRQKTWASLARQGYDPDLIEQAMNAKPED